LKNILTLKHFKQSATRQFFGQEEFSTTPAPPRYHRLTNLFIFAFLNLVARLFASHYKFVTSNYINPRVSG
jgi:hypothetical protein